MKGYKFTTEESAINAITSINSALGIPKEINSTTQTWTNYNLAEFNSPQFYYIRHDAVVEKIIGSPEEFNVIFENLN